MSKKDNEILNDLELLLKKKNDSNIDVLVLYSLLNKNIPEMDNILNISNEHTLKIQAENLKRFIINFKISNSILSQMIKENIDKETFDEIKKKYNLEIEFDNLNSVSMPPLRSLIGYNNLLKENDFLIDDKLINFLSYLENGHADNASLSFEELTELQKSSIPDDLQDWINKNTLYC